MNKYELSFFYIYFHFAVRGRQIRGRRGVGGEKFLIVGVKHSYKVTRFNDVNTISTLPFETKSNRN